MSASTPRPSSKSLLPAAIMFVAVGGVSVGSFWLLMAPSTVSRDVQTQAMSAEDCRTRPFSGPKRGLRLYFPTSVWTPTTYVLMRTVEPRVQTCPGVQIALYDMRTRKLLARHYLPPTSQGLRATNWTFYGDHTQHQGFLKFTTRVREGRDDALFIDLATGSSLRFSELKDKVPAVADRLFVDGQNRMHPTPNGIFLELNDGTTALVRPEDNHIEAAETGQWYRNAMARQHGCDKGYARGEDKFASQDNRSSYIGGTTMVTTLRPKRIDFQRVDSSAKYVLRFSSGSESLPADFVTQDAFFVPRVFVPAECAPANLGREVPAPLLVWHQTNLDARGAQGRLTRVDVDGRSVWTKALPFLLRGDVPVRYFDSTIFVYLKSAKTALWIDIDTGTVSHRLDLGELTSG